MQGPRRSALLEKLLVAVCGAPVVATLMANACGGKIDDERSPGTSGPAPEQSQSNGRPSEHPPGDRSAVPPPRPPRPGAPAYCPEPLEQLRSERCQDEALSLPVCFPLPEDGGSCESLYSTECILWGYECGLQQRGDSVMCSIPVTDACCWQVRGDCPVGRPFVVSGRAKQASIVADAAWAGSSLAAPDLEHAVACLDLETRATIADAWARDGLAEHASIASFARFVMELLALGAPPDLVTAAQRALAEEIAHAQRCFSLASIYAGAPRGPSGLDVSGALAQAPDLFDFAARTASEGCVAETVSALQIHAAADAAQVPAVSAVLRSIADEESEHAVLAWRAVRWAIQKGGEGVRRVVADVFARASAHVGFGPCPDEATNPAVLGAHGILTRRVRHDLAVATLESVVAPAAATLLSAVDPRGPALELEHSTRGLGAVERVVSS